MDETLDSFEQAKAERKLSQKAFRELSNRTRKQMREQMLATTERRWQREEAVAERDARRAESIS